MGKDTDIKVDTYSIPDAPREETINDKYLTEIFEILPNKRHDIRSYIDPYYTRITCSNPLDKVASFRFLDETDFRVDVQPNQVVTLRRKVNGKMMAFLNIGDVNVTIKITQEE